MRSSMDSTQARHHLDLIVGVFKAKLEELKDMLLKKDIIGKVRMHVYVVEFQKGVYCIVIFC